MKLGRVLYPEFHALVNGITGETDLARAIRAKELLGHTGRLSTLHYMKLARSHSLDLSLPETPVTELEEASQAGTEEMILPVRECSNSDDAPVQTRKRPKIDDTRWQAMAAAIKSLVDNEVDLEKALAIGRTILEA
jgi:hypothetical protein